MKSFIIGGHEIALTFNHSSISICEKTGADDNSAPVILTQPHHLISKSEGWVAGANRSVQVWSAGDGLILRVDKFQDFYIASGGNAILPTDGSHDLTQQEREVVLGPGLVLALAMVGRWCLHCSAALYHGQAYAFLGESGFGKSTLAEFLHNEVKPGWQRIVDDIIPVTLGRNGLVSWPHFPQLKLQMDLQSSHALPEMVKIKNIFVLSPNDEGKSPVIHKLTKNEAIQVLLGNTAGTRLFSPELLAAHLEFCAQAVNLVSVCQLSYPHQRQLLPAVQDLIEQAVVNPYNLKGLNEPINHKKF